ncbi:MAG TPA: Gfo/Idh/MocA family oxidoreductase, partial [Candidatus Sulfotelmatobacter sp.]|nr:Gfo/Idh/MocA family oxidoreductase [Candidatus Sulfotelmatobacter sp.]
MATTNSQNSTREVNIAVVGLGFMGVTHLRAYQQVPGARIAAVCDAVRLPVNGVLQGVAGNIKKSDDIDLGSKVKVCRKLEEVLADPEVELVDLCTPTPLHPEQAIAALKAGKHVLCEKPLARTSASAWEILQVAQAAPGFLMPAMCMRFWPGWSWLKQVVEQQAYGKVFAARFRRLSEAPTWSKQGTYTGGGADLGGALFDLHIHDTDFVQFLFGRPESVFSTGLGRNSNSIDHVVTQYLYPAGPAVHAEGGWLLTKGFHMSYTLLCERATLDFDLARGPEAMIVTEEGQAPRVIKYDGPDGYGEEVRYVVECVQRGQPPAIVTARDGLSALEICEA